METAYRLSQAFVSMLAEHRAQDLDDWLVQAKQSGILERKSFAQGIRRDDAAVRAAFTSAWSNGKARDAGELADRYIMDRLRQSECAIYSGSGCSVACRGAPNSIIHACQEPALQRIPALSCPSHDGMPAYQTARQHQNLCAGTLRECFATALSSRLKETDPRGSR
jgi:hypothetical protein